MKTLEKVYEEVDYVYGKAFNNDSHYQNKANLFSDKQIGNNTGHVVGDTASSGALNSSLLPSEKGYNVINKSTD